MFESSRMEKTWDSRPDADADAVYIVQAWPKRITWSSAIHPNVWKCLGGVLSTYYSPKSAHKIDKHGLRLASFQRICQKRSFLRTCPKKNEVAKNFSSFNHIPAVPPHLPHPQPAPFRRGTAAPSTSASTPLWVALAPSVAMRVTEEEALSNCGCHGWDFPWDFPWEFPGEFPWEFPGEFHGKWKKWMWNF